MKDVLNRHRALKVYALLVKFISVFSGEEQIASKSFIAKTHDIFATTLLGDWFNDHVKQPILGDVEEFEENGSDWKLHLIERLTININEYNPMRASSCIDLPQQINRKQPCVNMKNLDNQCLKWAILSALHPVNRRDNNYRVSKYKKYDSE